MRTQQKPLRSSSYFNEQYNQLMKQQLCELCFPSERPVVQPETFCAYHQAQYEEALEEDEELAYVESI